MATTTRKRVAVVEHITKTVVAPVPVGTVDWSSSDHSIRIADLTARAERAGLRIINATWVRESIDPDSPYSCLLEYDVEVETDA